MDAVGGNSNSGQAEPHSDCQLCPRLVQFRRSAQTKHPNWFNRPVPSFGAESAEFLIVGLAPGLQGANKTGRPFTGDYAGDLLYATLINHGFATGEYKADPNDGLRLLNCMISNAVRCVPPQNKPTGAEIRTCRQFLTATIARLTELKVILALGRIAHDSTLQALDEKKSKFPFGHNNTHELARPNGNVVVLVDSYHCSRYNTNTGRLTPQMFNAAFDTVRAHI